MFGFPGTGIREMVIIIVIIIILWWTGLWPVVIRGLRELRGERVDDTPGRRSKPSPPAKHGSDLCYKMLGIAPSATWDEIEKAYRSKAKLHHPDRGGDDDTMRALNDAYAHIKALRGKK